MKVRPKPYNPKQLSGQSRPVFCAHRGPSCSRPLKEAAKASRIKEPVGSKYFRVWALGSYLTGISRFWTRIFGAGRFFVVRLPVIRGNGARVFGGQSTVRTQCAPALASFGAWQAIKWRTCMRPCNSL